MVYVLAIELIKELMEYEVSETILQKLVSLLRPSKEEIVKRPEILEGIPNIFFFLSKEKWKENSKCLLRKQKTNWLDNAKHNFDCCIHGQDVYNPLPSCHGCRGGKKFVAHSKFRPVWVMHGQSFGVFSAFTFYNLIAVHVTSIQIENNNIILIHIPGILLVHTM